MGAVSSSVAGPLPAGGNVIGRIAPPTATGAAPPGTNLIQAASTYQVAFAAGSLLNGGFIQNPANSGATLSVDIAGATGTALQPTSQDIMPGETWALAFSPTNAVTVFSTALISFRSGQW